MVSLEPFLPHLPAWLLVLFRLTGIFLLGPLFGSSLIPAQIKIFLAVGLSLCIYPMLIAPGTMAAPHIAGIVGTASMDQLSMWALAPAVATELMIGLVIGYGANLPVLGIQMGGQMLDQQLGLGIGGVFNPELDAQATIISQFLSMFAIALFVILGGHRVMLATLVGSFSYVPLGGFSPDGHMVDLIVGMLSSMLDLSIRVVAPVMCLIFLETITMGFVARTVPQMNILSFGFVVRIILGTIVLIGVLEIMSEQFQTHLNDVLGMMSRFFNAGPPGLDG